MTGTIEVASAHECFADEPGKRIGAWAFVCLVLSVSVLGRVAPDAYAVPGGDGPTPDAMFSTLRDRIGRIHTIRYTAVSRGESRSIKNPPNSVTIENRTETVIKEDRFLAKVRVSNSELEGIKESTHAFDGIEYQLLDSNRATLSTNTAVSRDQVVAPYRAPQPITIMFTFALDRVLYRDYTALKDAALWDKIAAKSRVVGREAIGSVPCVVIRVDGLPERKNATLYLAERFGFYPLKVEFDTGLGIRTDAVDQFETVADGEVSVIVPTKVTTSVTMKASGQKSTSVLTVESGTLAVNTPVRDAIFTLPKSQVPVRIDVAKGNAYKDTGLVQERDRGTTLSVPAGGSMDSFVLFVSVGLIALGLSLTALRKFLSQRSRGG